MHAFSAAYAGSYDSFYSTKINAMMTYETAQAASAASAATTVNAAAKTYSDALATNAKTAADAVIPAATAAAEAEVGAELAWVGAVSGAAKTAADSEADAQRDLQQEYNRSIIQYLDTANDSYAAKKSAETSAWEAFVGAGAAALPSLAPDGSPPLSPPPAQSTWDWAWDWGVWSLSVTGHAAEVGAGVMGMGLGAGATATGAGAPIGGPTAVASGFLFAHGLDGLYHDFAGGTTGAQQAIGAGLGLVGVDPGWAPWIDGAATIGAGVGLASAAAKGGVAAKVEAAAAKFGPNTLGAAQIPPQVLQTGGHVITARTSDALGLSKDQAKRAMEGIKGFLLQGANHHQHKILSNGDVLDSHTGQLLGNLYDYTFWGRI